MFLTNLLHFYQPYNQQMDILDRIVHESYLPLIKGFLDRPNAKAIVNINGGLLNLLQEHGYEEVLQGLKTLLDRGQMEFTGSAMYHAFLPLLPEAEIKRQIMLNDEKQRHCFGDSFSPIGFFSPEMAVSDTVLEIVSGLGYKWIAAPQVAFGPSLPDLKSIYRDEKTGLSVFFRNKRVSSLILSAVTRSAKDLIEETQDIQCDNCYWFTVMDAETFGHHRVRHERFLFELLDSKRFDTCTAKDLLELSYQQIDVSLRPSTWTNEEQDFWLEKEGKKEETTAKSFVLWKDPENPIHKLQWEFVDFVISEVDAVVEASQGSVGEARHKLDIALASDQFWWASAKPWWSLEMIEQGAYMLKDVIYTLSASEELRKKADNFYRKILDQAFEWQRTGYIRKKHLENSKTFMQKSFGERTPPEWYNQIILEFEDEMNKASQSKDFEKAIKWRDALEKLKSGLDIYDVLHVVDELWSARSIPEVKPFLKHKWEEFSNFAKGQFRDEQGNLGLGKDSFENWGSKSTNS